MNNDHNKKRKITFLSKLAGCARGILQRSGHPQAHVKLQLQSLEFLVGTL